MLHYCVDVEELFGEHSATAKFLFECDRLEQLDELLLNDWRGEARKNPESQWFCQGDIAWRVYRVTLVKADDVPVLRRYLSLISVV